MNDFGKLEAVSLQTQHGEPGCQPRCVKETLKEHLEPQELWFWMLLADRGTAGKGTGARLRPVLNTLCFCISLEKIIFIL